jgi:chemotaxis protein histidine kinase CheA
MKKQAPFFAVIIVSIAFAGCCTKPIERGVVQRDWVLTFSELGIVPTFPPREDIVVGDVYLYDFDPNALSNYELLKKRWDQLTPDEQQRRQSLGMHSRLARIDVNDAIDGRYAQTLAAPPTSADYNAILGNPAIASANAAVKDIEEKIKEVSDKINAAKAAATKAEQENAQATQDKARIDQNLKVAQAALAKKLSLAPDTKKEEDAVSVARTNLRAAEDNLATAQEAQATAVSEDDKKATAAKVAEMERKKARAIVEVTRANEDLASAKTKKVNADAEQQRVDGLLLEQQAAETRILTTNQAQVNLTAEAARVTVSETPKVETLRAQLDAAKAVQKAITDAGARMLYPQPQYDNESVFTAGDLSSAEVRGKSRRNRLRLVAFPEFSTVSISSADLAAMVPIDALGLGLNLSSENISQVSVKIPAAESYAISVTDLVPLLLERRATSRSNDKNVYEWYIKDHSKNPATESSILTVARLMHDNPTSLSERGKIVYLRVVTEVFYARAMDVGIFASKSFGGRASVNSPTAQSKDTNIKDFDAAAVIPSSDLLSQIAERVSTAQLLPGGSVQVLTKNESSIGIRRVFDRPVAIGFRGLVLALDLQSGKVTKVVEATGPVSTLLETPEKNVAK